MYEYSVPLKQVAEDFNLRILYAASDYEQVRLIVADVNRPGVELAGYFEHFDPCACR